MSREQLLDIILDAYDARKETKEYFEFFLNPDVKKMIEKCDEKIRKEINKSKHGYAKFRITVIKNVIKDFASLNPGHEHVINLMMTTIVNLVGESVFLYFSDAQDRSVMRLVTDTLSYADKHGYFPQVATEILKLANNSRFGQQYIRQQLLDTVEEFQSQL